MREFRTQGSVGGAVGQPPLLPGQRTARTRWFLELILALSAFWCVKVSWLLLKCDTLGTRIFSLNLKIGIDISLLLAHTYA